MSDATLTTIVTAILAAIPPTLVALAALKQGQKNGAKADEIGADAKVAAAKAEVAASSADTAIKQIDEVHSSTKAIALQTDGHMSKLTTQNDELRQMVTQLVGMLRPSVAAPAAGSAAAHDSETLLAIEQHTGDTVELLKKGPI